MSASENSNYFAKYSIWRIYYLFDGNTMYPVIVVLAYRRATALNRLLCALEMANYPERVKLIISLEGGASKNVIEIATNFKPSNLSVEVIHQSKKLGLRDHVIACGDLSLVYGSIILLEDDLFVDPFFYWYASKALDFYSDDNAVAGIALYGHQYNEYAGLPFHPMFNGYSTYLMQLSCSWGQCWSKNQWSDFKNWYKGKDSQYLYSIEGLPLVAKNWPETSWKKYFHGYLVEKSKFFVYPYQSFSTNCSDSGGEHIKQSCIIHHVSLGSDCRKFVMSDFVPSTDREVIYDAYMEPIGNFVWRALGFSANEVEIDLQGIKPRDLLIRKELVLTAKRTKNTIRKFQQSFRPPEMNLKFPVLEENKKCWVLAYSIDIRNNNKQTKRLAWFAYYAGMNLDTPKIYQATLYSFIQKLIKKIFA